MDMISEIEEVRQAQRCLLTRLGVMRMLTVAAGLCALMVAPVWAADMACVIKPYAEISIGTPVEGLIQTVAVDRGDWVTKGQVIVTLESSLEEATVALAKAKAEAEAVLKSSQVKIGFSSRKLERALELFRPIRSPNTMWMRLRRKRPWRKRRIRRRRKTSAWQSWN